MYKYIHFILFDMKLSPNQKKITSVVVIVLCVVGFVLLLVWLFGGFDSDGDGTLTSTSLTNLTSTNLTGTNLTSMLTGTNLTSSITLETASGEPSTMLTVPMTTTSVPMTTPMSEQTAFIYEQKSDDFATCPSSTIMNITNAFARPTSNTAYATKGSADVTNSVKGICDGNQSCAIYWSGTHLQNPFTDLTVGDPFSGEQKKVQVHYRCV